MALGYSAVNGIDVYPGIRYTGRLAGDPLGQMTLARAWSSTVQVCKRRSTRVGRLYFDEHRSHR